MPSFFTAMPSPKAGRYAAEVRTFSHFGPGRIRHRSVHNGRLRAYLVARLAALWADIQTSDVPELGVRWTVEEVK
jgi:hypothetical protein